MNSYKTVRQDGISEYTEKKSRFISYVYPVSAESDALSKLEKLRKKHYDATHVVFAYKIKENNIQRFSDDGEPQGTAGVPVLEVINKGELTDVMIAVARYFGGTLLGAGGLVRAYSKSASLGVASAIPVNMCECTLFDIECPYTLLGKLQNTLSANGAKKNDIIYADNITLKYYIKEEDLDKLIKDITEASNGSCKVKVTDTEFKIV